jgi:hypothetical protein
LCISSPLAREANRKTIHCTLRLPDDGLEDQIKAPAHKHGRTLNGELVCLLRGAVMIHGGLAAYGLAGPRRGRPRRA